MPEITETELRNLGVEDLGEHARALGIEEAHELSHSDLLSRVRDRYASQARGK